MAALAVSDTKPETTPEDFSEARDHNLKTLKAKAKQLSKSLQDTASRIIGHDRPAPKEMSRRPARGLRPYTEDPFSKSPPPDDKMNAASEESLPTTEVAGPGGKRTKVMDFVSSTPKQATTPICDFDVSAEATRTSHAIMSWSTRSPSVSSMIHLIHPLA